MTDWLHMPNNSRTPFQDLHDCSSKLGWHRSTELFYSIVSSSNGGAVQSHPLVEEDKEEEEEELEGPIFNGPSGSFRAMLEGVSDGLWMDDPIILFRNGLETSDSLWAPSSPFRQNHMQITSLRSFSIVDSSELQMLRSTSLFPSTFGFTKKLTCSGWSSIIPSIIADQLLGRSGSRRRITIEWDHNSTCNYCTEVVPGFFFLVLSTIKHSL